MRNMIVVLAMLIGSMVTPAMAQVSVGVALPGVNIGINVPVYPELVPVPGYPVYYAPRLNSNYFFYDGRYWVFSDDNWYDSAWYNGPWQLVSDDAIPLFLLRVPVRYYRRPPSYFRGWALNGSPRWGDHWGNRWVDRHRGWDRWDRNVTPRRAPLPVYQRQYSGDRYPRAEQQQALHGQNYRYAPRNDNTVQHDRTTRGERMQGTSPQVTRAAPEARALSPRENRVRVPAAPPPAAAQRAASPRQAQAQAPAPQRGPQGNGAERGQGNSQERGRGNAQERGRGNGQTYGRANPDNQQ